ncbi:MAG TPA: pilus assembly protein N-terminal domain-containing protein [Nitrospiraceae bacterium]|nr:pilus assembly protein N-terminal domain-containing protein [Nitrospiraceae bacterium]
MKSITRSKSQNLNLASVIAGTIVAAGSLLGQPLWANSSASMISAQASKDVQALDLVLGKSTVVDVPVVIKRASLANPAIADAIVLSPKQIYVTGKGFGSTNLTLWGKDDQILAIFDVEVVLDVARLTQKFSRLLPDETNLHLVCSNDHLTLAGTVSSPAKLSQALAVAEAYAPKKVINLLKIYPEQPSEVKVNDREQVTVEVIRGTAVNSVKF